MPGSLCLVRGERKVARRLFNSKSVAKRKRCQEKKIESQSGMYVRSGQPFFGLETSYNQTKIPAILYVDIFASLCVFLLWKRAIVILDPVRAGMVYYSLPVFTGFLGYLFLGEAIGIIRLFSMVVILTGVFMANQSAR